MTEETLFAAALEKAIPADRAAFLEEACAGDGALRRRVEALLWSHENTLFMNKPAVDVGANSALATTAAATDPADHSIRDDLLDFLDPSEKPDSLGRLDHYEVHELIGHGGMGVVLRAFDERLHRVVAIKVMAGQLASSATARKRFTREAQAAAAVSHDHIVTIHAVEEAGGRPYLVMQYVAGMSLQDRLDAGGPLRLAEILRIGFQAASGLAAAHAQGLVHRDIKPANILLENGVERVKITDFGLARAVDDASLTQSGVVAGTPQYMSPEQAEGKAVDARTDLFSLGSVLYAMCTGRAPFRAGGTMAVLKRVCEDAPSPIREANPEIPDSLVAIIDKLHAKDPGERFQSAMEVAQTLGQYLAHVQHPSLKPQPPDGVRACVSRSRGRKRWPLAVALLVCLAAGAGVSEATGVTRLSSTVIRILTPHGTLVVESNDPAVRVTVENDGGVVIADAGTEEVRLRPGSYQVRATKDGKPVNLDRDLVTITRDNKQRVRVRLEESSPSGSASGARGAFAVVNKAGGPDLKFDTLASAVIAAASGDIVEIRGNGPFVTPPIAIGQGVRVIRAGLGYRPVIRFVREELDTRVLIASDASLILEGLDIRSGPPGAKQSPIGIITGPSLHVANCRFHLPEFFAIWAQAGRGRCVVKNCEFVACHRPLMNEGDGTEWIIDNCTQVGGGATLGINLASFKVMRASVTRLTNLANHTFQVHLRDAYPPDANADKSRSRLHLKVASSVLAGNFVIETVVTPERAIETTPVGSTQYERQLQRLLTWEGGNNLYSIMPYSKTSGRHFLIATRTITNLEQHAHGPQALAGWREFWHSEEVGSIEGEARFKGGDLQAKSESAPEELTSDDFRLRPDSAGYRAGPHGDDLGAFVDHVGPGTAYARWKATPEYQEWLAQTGQFGAMAPRTGERAFVLLGGKGVEERRFDTLADAVVHSSDGDTIEIRGNGPFITEPVTVDDRRALAIRAGKGFRPVIRLAHGEGEDRAHLLSTAGPLVLEGLEIQCQRKATATSSLGFCGVVATGSMLRVANCRFVTPFRHTIFAPSSASVVVRNCEFLSSREWNDALAGGSVTGGDWEMVNCVVVGGAAVSCAAFTGDGHDATVRIRRCSLVASLPLFCNFHAIPMDRKSGQAVPLFRAEVMECVIDSGSLLGVLRSPGFLDKGNPLHDAGPEDAVPRLIRWRGTNNVHHRLGNGTPEPANAWIWWSSPTGSEPIANVTDLASWRKFWGSPEEASVEREIRYQGGDLASRLGDGAWGITPEDFRLRPDSGGYSAGRDGKDLGAQVDLVGPGAGYERWKKTPEYEAWLREIEQKIRI